MGIQSSINTIIGTTAAAVGIGQDIKAKRAQVEATNKFAKTYDEQIRNIANTVAKYTKEQKNTIFQELKRTEEALRTNKEQKINMQPNGPVSSADIQPNSTATDKQSNTYIPTIESALATVEKYRKGDK